MRRRNQIDDPEVKEKLDKLLPLGRKKWVRYDEGALLYSMGLHSFEELAKKAKAVYHYNRIVLVNTEKVDEYMELMCADDPTCKFRSNGAANSHRRCACFGFIGAEHRPMGSFSWYYQARMLIPFISSLRLCRLSVSRDKTASA